MGIIEKVYEMSKKHLMKKKGALDNFLLEDLTVETVDTKGRQINFFLIGRRFSKKVEVMNHFDGILKHLSQYSAGKIAVIINDDLHFYMKNMIAKVNALKPKINIDVEFITLDLLKDLGQSTVAFDAVIVTDYFELDLMARKAINKIMEYNKECAAARYVFGTPKVSFSKEEVKIAKAIFKGNVIKEYKNKFDLLPIFQRDHIKKLEASLLLHDKVLIIEKKLSCSYIQEHINEMKGTQEEIEIAEKLNFMEVS